MKLKKLSFLLLFTILIPLFSACKKAVSVPENGVDTANGSPNIVFIIADDMGWDAFGKRAGYNGQKANTPTLDSLAKTGITYTNFWVNPVCSPTRASLITGKYGFRTGVGGVDTPPTAVLQTSEVSLQKYISTQTSNAYATALIGKWHLSQNSNLTAPESFEMGYFSGFMSGMVNDYYDWTQTSNGKQETISTYSTTHFVNQSVTWINQQTKPFFLWLAFNAPHTPFHRPPLELITDKTLTNTQANINKNPLPYYLAAIEAMDKEIARLIAGMPVAKRENTVFVFIGDNGTPGQVVQEPYTNHGGKGYLFEGGVNTPLIVSGKNITRKNETDNSLVQAPDIFATIAELTDGKTSSYKDGNSIKGTFTNKTAFKRNYVYTEQFGNTNTNNDGYTLRNNGYKYIKLENGKEYFYKISADPTESNNLISGTMNAEDLKNLDELKKVKTGL